MHSHDVRIRAETSSVFQQTDFFLVLLVECYFLHMQHMCNFYYVMHFKVF